MGRELKRVPLDFDWPMGRVWYGYLNPHAGPKTCSVCGGSGWNEATREVYRSYYDHENFGVTHGYHYYIGRDGKPAKHPPWKTWGELPWSHNITQDEVQALVDAGRLMDFTHTWSQEEGWKPREDGYIPTAEEVNEWSWHGMGHDGINCHILVKTRAKRLGIYGECPVCEGKGEIKNPDAAKQKAYEEWAPIEPPVGDGFQLWGTTSEGNPASPVFPSLDELCTWCETNATTFADYTATAAEWKQMLDGGMVHHTEGNVTFI